MKMLYTQENGTFLLIVEEPTPQVVVRGDRRYNIFCDTDVDKGREFALQEGDVCFSASYKDIDNAKDEEINFMIGHIVNGQMTLGGLKRKDLDETLEANAPTLKILDDLVEALKKTLIYEICVNGVSLDGFEYATEEEADYEKMEKGFHLANVIAKVNSLARLDVTQLGDEKRGELDEILRFEEDE